MPKAARRQSVPLEVVVRNPKWFGRRFPELVAMLPPDVHATAIREEHRNRVPTDATVLDDGDVLLLVSTDVAALEQVRHELGEAAHGRITKDRGDLDYFQVFVSSRQAAGSSLSELAERPARRARPAARAAWRCRPDADGRARARTRRPRRPALRPRPHRRGAPVLRRLDPEHRRHQLRVDRRRCGARPAGRHWCRFRSRAWGA